MATRIEVVTWDEASCRERRRVLDPGSFECVDNVDEKWLYLVTEEVHQALSVGSED